MSDRLFRNRLFSAVRWIAFLLPLTVLPGCNQIDAQLDKLSAFASGESSGEGGSGLLGALSGEEGSGDRSNKAYYYQYVDENGSVHFVKGLHEIPAKFRDQVRHVEFERKERKPGAEKPSPGSTTRTSNTRTKTSKRTQTTETKSCDWALRLRCPWWSSTARSFAASTRAA